MNANGRKCVQTRENGTGEQMGKHGTCVQNGNLLMKKIVALMRESH